MVTLHIKMLMVAYFPISNRRPTKKTALFMLWIGPKRTWFAIYEGVLITPKSVRTQNWRRETNRKSNNNNNNAKQKIEEIILWRLCKTIWVDPVTIKVQPYKVGDLIISQMDQNIFYTHLITSSLTSKCDNFSLSWL